MSTADPRKYHVIVWGASGFTGRLVTEYLFNQYGIGKKLKWAIAGRNKGKLQSVRSIVANDSLPIIVADSDDRASLDAMTSQAKVICTTVGPYAKYGTVLVASCVANKTDYCDLTGEVQWMRRIIDEYHDEAVSKGVRIVHTCGIDSIPSDMGVYFLQKEIHKKTGEYARHVKGRVRAFKGGFSGGTFASLDNVMIEAKKDPSIFKTLNNPYGLNPADNMSGPDKPDLQSILYDKDLKSWIGPFIMAMINTKVVRRSHALSGFPYGADFRYDEATLTGKGLTGKLKGWGLLGAMGVLTAGKPGTLLHTIIQKAMPKPGEGPSKKMRESGYFKLLFMGIMKDGSTHLASVSGDRDPGYGSTSKMLGESAVCLALDKSITPDTAGILTPSVAMGDALLDRLQNNAGLQFSIQD